MYIVGECLGKEEHDPLSHSAERTVVACFSEARVQFDLQPRFFENFPGGSLPLILAKLHMSLRERPVSAVLILYKQNLCFVLCAVKHQRSARLLVKTVHPYKPEAPHALQTFFDQRLIVYLPLGRSDKLRLGCALQLGYRYYCGVDCITRLVMAKKIDASPVRTRHIIPPV